MVVRGVRAVSVGGFGVWVGVRGGGGGGWSGRWGVWCVGCFGLACGGVAASGMRYTLNLERRGTGK